MNLAGPNEWWATREWKDISTKWRLVPAGLRSELPGDPFAQGWQALESGRLDEAQHAFEEAVRRRGDGNDYVALGDVYAARRDWARAADQFERALLVAPLSVLAVLGLAMVRAATGAAAMAVAELRVLAGTRPGDPVVGYYLAEALIARTVEVRGEAPGGRLVIQNVDQFDACEDLARQVLACGTDDVELVSAAESLLAETRSGHILAWTDGNMTMVFAVLVVVLGVAPVLVGGLFGSLPVVVAGVVVGGALVFWLYFRYRRPVWQIRANRTH
jgi:tetratricopeptide (TPR) repeat protein